MSPRHRITSTVQTLLASAIFVLAAVSAGADTYTVTNTADSGAGSLRQAILDANAHPGTDTIAFNIPGGRVQTIAVPVTALPVITSPVVIDGRRSPDTPEVR
jgi:hypothetical protein